MRTARDMIFGDLADALGSRNDDDASIDAEALALIQAPDEARPELPSSNTVESFRERASGPKVGATVDRISDDDALPEAVGRYLASKKLPLNVSLQPASDLTALDWAEAGIGFTNAVDEGVAIGMARWGIAETGSVVFHSAEDMPILFNFLPAVHIVAIRARQIFAHLEDYAAAARQAGDPAPRNACLITGASGTTDIEGSLVKGAHGPRDLHIIIIDDDAEGDASEPFDTGTTG